MFGVNFADGRIKGYGKGASMFEVKYVRGNPAYGINDFQDNGEGTISDLATGLMWAQDDAGLALNWQGALAYAVQKNAAGYLGYSDWRVPNAKELHSIIDYTRAPDSTNSAAIDPMFNCTPTTNELGQTDWHYYWSSTTHLSSTGRGASGVYLCFGRCMGYMNNVWTNVHGAGAQRSDPKDGDPADYPVGRGPQGDSIHIFNMVRLVRDI
jgi:hypothetical protein